MPLRRSRSSATRARTGDAVGEVVMTLRDAIPISPWAIALWLAAAIVLAGALVYGWRRLLRS